MPHIDGKILLKLAVRGSMLFLLLAWFAHVMLSQPKTKPVQDPKTFLGRLAIKAGVSEGEARSLLEELGPAIADELKKGNQVQLPGLGKFRMVKRPGYTAFDEITGKQHIVPASVGVDYQPSQDMLKEVLNTKNPKWAESQPQPSSPTLRTRPAAHKGN